MSRVIAVLIAACFALGSLPSFAQTSAPADQSTQKMDKEQRKAERKAKKEKRKADKKAKKDAKKAKKEADKDANK
jgi:uncharacterized membrane protein